VVEARLAVAVRKAADLTEFVRVRLTDDREGRVATPVPSQSSGVLTGLGSGAALLVGPAAERQLAAGSRHRVILLDAEASASMNSPF
jgi:molybdopterin biosynthesis enzyme